MPSVKEKPGNDVADGMRVNIPIPKRFFNICNRFLSCRKRLTLSRTDEYSLDVSSRLGAILAIKTQSQQLPVAPGDYLFAVYFQFQKSVEFPLACFRMAEKTIVHPREILSRDIVPGGCR